MAALKDTEGGQGFRGSLEGLAVADMIRLAGSNRFSGCITVSNGQAFGLVFFREGRVIHAEQGERFGEEALHEILAWTSGSFNTEPNVSTTSCTIGKDFRPRAASPPALSAGPLSAGPRTAATAAPPAERGSPAAAVAGAAALVARIRALSGVVYAVLTGKDGSCSGDFSSRAEVQAGRAAYLAAVGGELGRLFSAGVLRSAVLRGGAERMLLLASRNHYLSVLVDAHVDVGAVEDEVRKLLARTA